MTSQQKCVVANQGLDQEMIKGSPNILIAIRWNLATFFFVQAENGPSKRRLDGSLAKSWWQIALAPKFDHVVVRIQIKIVCYKIYFFHLNNTKF